MAAGLLDPAGAGGLSPRADAGRPRADAGRPGADAGLAEAVLTWWATARVERDRLPWRSTRDPWAVLVAETMLVQTQAARVAPRFAELLARFPDPAAMAAAPLGEVLRSWSGLGYNRRAAWLQATARRLVEAHAGRVPDDLEALLGLPGVGAYTARAVLAFAFGEAVGVVDTNVGRVLARAVAGTRLTTRAAQACADALVVPGKARSWNLALMDLGAVVCTPRPACGRCPLAAGSCTWRRAPGAGDPAAGSAGTSRAQAPFAGSDRQARGRLVRAALGGPIDADEVAAAAGWPSDVARARRVAAALVREGLLVADEAGRLRTP